MSTLAKSSGRTGAALLAIVTSFLVVLSGLAMAPAANAAPAGPTVQVAEAPREGGTVTVTGAGFAPEGVGVYVGIGAAGAPGFYQAGTSDMVWVASGNVEGGSGDGRTATLNADGTFSVTLTVPGFLDGINYAIYTSKAHGQGMGDRSQDSMTAVAYAAPAPTATSVALAASSTTVESGAPLTLTAEVVPVEATGSVSFFTGTTQIGDAQVVNAGIASLTTAELSAGDHSMSASFTPSTDAFEGSTSAAVAVTVNAAPVESEPVEPEPVEPGVDPTTISASVTDSSPAGLELSATVDNIVLGASHQGVYIGIIEKDRVSEYGSNAGAGAAQDFAYKTFIVDGSVTRNIEVPAEKLDRSKEYVAVTWLAHGFLNDESFLAQTAIEITETEWDTLFAPSVQATVTSADASGLKLSAEVSGLIPGDLPTGVHVGVLPASLDLESATSSDFIGRPGTVKPENMPAEGAFSLDLDVPAAGLTRGESLQVLVWKRHTNPSATNNLASTVVSPEAADWEAVFGALPSISASVVDASKDGLKLEATVENIVLRAADDVPDTGKDDAGVYVALIESDLVDELANGAEASVVADFAYKMFIRDGKVTRSIVAPASKLDRSKEYTVVSWLAHGNMTPERFLAQTELKVTSAQWNAVFGAPADESAATVQSVADGLLTVQAKVLGLTASDFPVGVYVGLVERGSAETAVMDDVYGTQWVRSIPAGGAVQQDLEPIENTQLDRNAKYDVLVWRGHSNPSATNNIKVLPVAISAAQWDTLFGTTPVAPKPKPTPKPAGVSQQAGSLSWGISSDFAEYTTSKSRPGGKSGGMVSTSGVGSGGGGYLFPQGNGGSWNSANQTGTVHYSGVVTFTAHHGLMSETFANPVITVASASSATMTVSGRTFSLNLAAASKTVGTNGEISWSGVPVNGSISGGGGGAGGSFAIDPLSFTVGSASAIQYGSTTLTEQKADREAAATPPATEGITVVTPADELVPGGEIELQAANFEANERDILVVLYSDPIVLDEQAGANADGSVRWIGTLPDDIETGTHTITLQGSTDAGAVITVVDPAKKTTVEKLSTTSSEQSAPQIAAAIIDPETGPLWLWWVGAAALIALAGAMGGLVISQRKAAAAAAASSNPVL